MFSWACMRLRLLCFALLAISGCMKPKLAVPARMTASGIANRTGLPEPPEPTRRTEAQLPPGVSLDRPLAPDDAAALALWKNTQLQADLAALGLARADVIDAWLLRNPRLDMLFPVGLKPFELLMNFPFDAFWSRPRRVQASQAAYDQLAQSLIQNGLNTVRDARVAHADLMLAMSREKAAERVAALRSRIVQLTNARLRAGDISELEAMAARNEEAATAEQLVRSRHDVTIANERLRVLLGLALNRATIQVVMGEPEVAAPPDAADLLEKSLAARPDLRAAEMSIQTATKRAHWERSRIFVLAGQLSSKGIGTNGILTGPGLSAELPVFHRNQGLIARADAEVELASRQYLNLKQRIAFEVHEARQLLAQAQEALAMLRKQVIPPLQQTVALAEQQYKNGDVSYLFVLEQSRGLVDAELRLVDAEAAVRRGKAQLERCVGTKW